MATSTIVLSPFPPTTSAAARTAAITLIKSQCGGRAVADDIACRLGEAAAELVEGYAPSAPQSLKNEACIRWCGYAAQAQFGQVSQMSAGSLQQSFAATNADAFRRSGAAGLLTRYRVRRARAIG